jgi:CO/xanthine dehydrogenase Mo-binding subunit
LRKWWTQNWKVEVLLVIAATDVGKSINPSNVEGQIEGGVVMGVGYALTEEVKQEKGYVKTKNLGEYMVSTSLDIPDIETHIVECRSQRPPGARGVRGPPDPNTYIPTRSQCLDVRLQSPGKPRKLHQLIH